MSYLESYLGELPSVNTTPARFSVLVYTYILAFRIEV